MEKRNQNIDNNSSCDRPSPSQSHYYSLNKNNTSNPSASDYYIENPPQLERRDQFAPSQQSAIRLAQNILASSEGISNDVDPWRILSGNQTKHIFLSLLIKRYKITPFPPSCHHQNNNNSNNNRNRPSSHKYNGLNTNLFNNVNINSPSYSSPSFNLGNINDAFTQKNELKQSHESPREDLSGHFKDPINAFNAQQNFPNDQLFKIKKRKRNEWTTLEEKVKCMHDFSKLLTCLELLDTTKGVQIFPQTPPESAPTYSGTCMDAFGMFMDANEEEHNNAFLGKRAVIGRSQHIIGTYIDRAAGHLHECLRLKFLNEFFSAFPTTNQLFTTDPSNERCKKEFAARINSCRELYKSNKYEDAWKSACHNS